MGISSGLLNHTLTLQTFTSADDGMGGMVDTWTDSGTFRARISPLTSQERLMQDKNTNVTTHKIYCDNMAVSPKDRIKWGNYYFEITGIVNPSEMYHHLEIHCREVDSV
uniref:Putative head-tail joining protein n=1 Tax=viral metagenome TaxID=1070528 RepID=A0A6M3LIG9_9ZZZZ